MSIQTERVIEIYKKAGNITDTALIYAKEIGATYDANFRRRIAYRIKKLDFAEEYENEFNENIEYTTLSAIKQDGQIMTIKEYCEFYGIDFNEVEKYTLVNHTNKAYYNIRSKNISNVIDLNKITEIIQSAMLNIEKPQTIERKLDGEHLLFVDPADVHIGKYSSAFEVGEADAYNPEIAYKRVHEAIDVLIQSSKAYKAEKILFIIGNDILHTDNTRRQTTQGTNQDTHGMWYENYMLAKKLYIEIILKLLDVADVHVQFNPSNHDYMSGFMLAETISTYFRECKNVTFDCDMSHRKYFKYGNNLIGTTHGDSGKVSDYPLAMAHEAADAWSTTKFRYFYTHHVHSKSAQDYMSVQVESLRSVSGADSWHHRELYQHAPKTISCMVHHKTKGRIATLSHTF